jgi:hypothetical protein
VETVASGPSKNGQITECVKKEDTLPTKKSRIGSKRITSEEDLVKEEQRAYKRWYYLNQRKKKGVAPKKRQKRKKDSRYGAAYLFYYDHFVSKNSRLERLFTHRYKKAIHYGKIFTDYYNHLLQSIEKFGTDEDRKRLNKLAEFVNNEESK